MLASSSRATALFGGLAMLTATGLALAPPASADEEQSIDSGQECFHDEDQEDEVYLELCLALQAELKVPTDFQTVQRPTVGFFNETVGVDETVSVEEKVCLNFCITIEEEIPVNIDQQVRLPEPGGFEDVTDVEIAELRKVTFDVGADGTRADVHPDRACEDNGFEEGCPGPEELPGPGDLPDPSDLLEEISRPGSSGSSGPAITHLADADQEGTFDGVILDPTPNAEDTGYYVGFEELV